MTVAFRLILVSHHLIVLAPLGIALVVVGVIAFFAALFTARWPGRLRDFALGVERWWLRVNGYLVLLTDEYPRSRCPEQAAGAPPAAEMPFGAASSRPGAVIHSGIR